MENKREQEQEVEIEFQELVSTLPKEKNWGGSSDLYLYQGLWVPFVALKGVISFQKHFEAHSTDIILASTPKSGTTWLKALIYLVANRSCCALNESPLLTSNPHHLLPFFELDLYGKSQCPDLEKIADPRIFATHIPYPSLPTSITDHSKCKIVYVCRNPLDQLISLWHFLCKMYGESIPLEEAFELYCKGIFEFGPFWKHVLGYWKASQENPDKVLFLKYEDLKKDNLAYTKKLAKFLGFPFSAKEEEEGVVEEICRICSFENLRSLEVNKNGKLSQFPIPNSAFFRKAQVGDWSNYLTPSMAERMKKLLQEKLKGSGLSFHL